MTFEKASDDTTTVTTVTYWSYYITIVKNYCYDSTITIITKPIIQELYLMGCGGLTFEKASDNAVRNGPADQRTEFSK